MRDKSGMRLGGLILAGGHSRRMGRSKESLPFGDSTLLGRQCDTLLACAAPVVVVARDRDQQLPPLPAAVEVIVDDDPGRGPLHALRAGLRHLAAAHRFGADDVAFATACDLPFLTAAAVRWLVDRLGEPALVMPRTDGRLHPLAAAYRVSALALVDHIVDAGGDALRELGAGPGARILDEAALRVLDPSLSWLRNVNDPRQYEAALARAARTHDGRRR